jgi:hypothetical protein
LKWLPPPLHIASGTPEYKDTKINKLKNIQHRLTQINAWAPCGITSKRENTSISSVAQNVGSRIEATSTLIRSQIPLLLTFPKTQTNICIHATLYVFICSSSMALKILQEEQEKQRKRHKNP